MPSTLYTGSASDWTNMLKEYKTNQSNISLWEQALLGLQETAKIQSQSLEASTDYDISQAYANYKKNQQQLQMKSNLGSGFKEQLQSNLQSAYQNTFAQSNLEKAQGLYNINQEYQENVSNVSDQFTQMGETLSGLSNRVFEYLGQYGSYIPGYENIDWSGNLQQQGIYQLDDTGNLVLTQKGQNALSYAMLNRVSVPDTNTTMSFEEWLGNSYGDELDNFRNYADVLRSGFGIESGTTQLDMDKYNETKQNLAMEDISGRAEQYLNKYTSQYVNNYNNDWSSFKSEISHDIGDILNITDKDVSVDDYYSGFSQIKAGRIKVSINSDVLSSTQIDILKKLGFTESNGKLVGRVSTGIGNDITYDDLFKNLSDPNFVNLDTNKNHSY